MSNVSLQSELHNVFAKYAGPMMPPSSAAPAPAPSTTPPQPKPPQTIPVAPKPTAPPPATKPLPTPTPTPAPAAPAAPPTPASPTAPETQSTIPTTSGAPATVPATNTPAPPATQQQPTPAPAFKEEDVNAMVAKLPQNNNISPEQNKQFATETLTWMKQPENQALLQGAQEYKAGNTNTPGAKQFAAALDKRRATFIEEQMAKATAADPAAASTPQGWGGMLQQATAAWEQMPTEMKWIMGLGLGGGLLGMASSIFGEGGMGMGLLGLLGLGAAGLTGAAGGVFGPGAQQGVSDAAFNVGSYLGMVPEAGSMKGEFNLLKDPNAVATLSAAPTLGEKIHTFRYPAEKQEEIRKTLAMLDKAKTFMRLPESMRSDWLQKWDPSLTPEQNKMVAQNLAGLVAQSNDPKSPLAQKVQSGQNFAAAKDPAQYVNQQAANAVVDGATNAWNSASEAASNAWNGAWDYLTKKNEDMTIYRLIEKWAFNDMDAKEVNDLKQQQAQGVSYRVEDARRLNELEKRRWAEAPNADSGVKKQVAVSMCQKAARCWAGYEPVPGKKPYSDNSCRPKGSKKPQKKTKKS